MVEPLLIVRLLQVQSRAPQKAGYGCRIQSRRIVLHGDRALLFVELQPPDPIDFAYVVDTPHHCFIRGHPIVVTDLNVRHRIFLPSFAAESAFGVLTLYYISHLRTPCFGFNTELLTFRTEREFILA